MKAKWMWTAALACLAVAGSVMAQSGTVVTIGGNYWNATMKPGEASDMDAKAGHLFGPYISLRMDRLSFGGSWFFGNWDYSEDDFSYKIKRSDLNLSLGLSLNRNLTLFGAYKVLKLKEAFESEEWDIDADENTMWDMPYIGGGLSLTFPFPDSPLFLFGSGAYLVNAKDEMKVTGVDPFLEEEYSYTQKVDDKITTFTVGLGYRMQSGISLLAGYRGDIHKSGEEDEDNNLKINGLILTLAYTLR